MVTGALLLASLVAPLAGAVAAQEQTQTPTPEESKESTVVAEIDQFLRVLDYGYDADNETFAVTVENVDDEHISTLTATEVITGAESGSGAFGIKQVRIRPQETLTVKVDVERRNGKAAVMLSTQESISNGRGTFLQEGDSRGFISGNASWWDVRIGAFVGISGSLGFVLLGAWHVVSQRDRGWSEVDLDE